MTEQKPSVDIERGSSSLPSSRTEDTSPASLLNKLGKFSVFSYSFANTLLYANNIIKSLKAHVGIGWVNGVGTAVVGLVSTALLETNIRSSRQAVASYQAQDGSEQERDEVEKKIKSQYPIKKPKILTASSLAGGVEKTGGVLTSTELFLDDYTGSYSGPSKILILPLVAYANLVAAVAISSPKKDNNSYLPLSSSDVEETFAQKFYSKMKKTHLLLVNAIYSSSNTFLYLPDTQKLLSDIGKSIRDWSGGDSGKRNSKIGGLMRVPG